MHASYEDVKMLNNLFHPKYFIPVKGLYKEFLKGEAAAVEAGIKPENVGIIDNGQVLKINSKHLAIMDKTIPCGDSYVDGSGIGDIGNVVLNERKLLAGDGVVIIGATIDSKSKASVSLVDIQMRGVLYISEDNPVTKIMQKEVNQILDQSTELFRKNPNKYSLDDVKREIVNKVKALVKQESGKNPMILCIVNEINGNFNLKAVLARSQKSRNYVHKATIPPGKDAKKHQIKSGKNRHQSSKNNPKTKIESKNK